MDCVLNYQYSYFHQNRLYIYLLFHIWSPILYIQNYLRISVNFICAKIYKLISGYIFLRIQEYLMYQLHLCENLNLDFWLTNHVKELQHEQQTNLFFLNILSIFFLSKILVILCWNFLFFFSSIIFFSYFRFFQNFFRWLLSIPLH